MEVMALSMFAASCLMLLTGYPVAFTLGGVSFFWFIGSVYWSF